MESDLQRVLLIIHELSDQIAHNHKLTTAIASQADVLQGQAKYIGNGFSLRRFSVDLSQETFDSELERKNAQIIIDNQTLLHENKQLSLLLKEYENTMSTILEKFRNHALAAQQHEITLQRHYETLLYTRESQSITSDLASSSELGLTVNRLCLHLRNLLRTLAGDPPDEFDDAYHHHGLRDYDPASAPETVDVEELMALLDELDVQTQEQQEQIPGPTASHPSSSRPTSLSTSLHPPHKQDWSVEREQEIARLEAENAVLRKHLGIDPLTIEQSGVDMQAELARMTAPRNPELLQRSGASSTRSRGGSGTGSPIPSEFRPSFWDANGNNQQQQQSPFMQPGPGQGQQQGRGAPMDYSGGMRMMQGMQGRRAGMFGQQPAPRGGAAGGSGRGVPIPLAPPSTSISLWNSQPGGQTQTERGWQQQQGPALDMNR